MWRRPVKEVNAEFSAETKYLDSIQRTVRESCVAAGMASKNVSAVLLATEEAATNIIRHAYLYEKGVMRIRIVIYRKQIVFSLIDYGRSFQPDARGRLDLDQLVKSGRKGGLGFYMMEKIMDSVQYISSADRNELRMIKRIGGGGRDSHPFLSHLFTLRVKFSFWTFFIVLFIVGGAFYYIDQQTTRQLRDRLDQTVAALTNTVANQASGNILRSRSGVVFDELVSDFARANPELELMVLTDTLGIVMAHSGDVKNIGKRYEPPVAASEVMFGLPVRYEEGERQLNYLVSPIRFGRRFYGQAHVVYSSDPISEPLSMARRRIFILTSLLLLFGVVGIYMLSNYFVRPIVNITRRVRRFASGDLESELPLEGAEEFFEISKAFNEIMTRLSQDRKNIAAREKMAREIEVASQIQRALLPARLPEVPGLELDAFYRAASVVGGDLYDVFQINPGRYCLVVADVSGKGVPAALVMSMLRTVIQIHAQHSTSAREILLRVNKYLVENIPSGMFVTVMLVVYDVAARNMKLVSAGHNAMLYYRAAQQETVRINPAGMPMGLTATLEKSFAAKLEEVSITLCEGDSFLIFTDGVTEAVNRDGEQFGMDRIENLFGSQTAAHSTVQPVANSIVAELDDFAGFAKPNDDITFLVGRATGESDPDDNKTDISTTVLRTTTGDEETTE
jgi:serine phosphatase RsbU (regulator of sigma subunit)/anti-sigma regulatory factor (Ser/Thr protein kinase)